MPNIFVKDGPCNDYIFDLQLPIINDNTIGEYTELTTAALIFCQNHQDEIKPHLSSNHLIPEAPHPHARNFIKRSSDKSDG